MNVHQVLCAAGPVDAVTLQARAYRRLFGLWGWGGSDVAGIVAPEMARGTIAPLHTLRAEPSDVVAVHYSGWVPEVDAVLDLPNPRLVISHNFTPARWFWRYQPVDGIVCALAPGQLARLLDGASLAAGVSEFNARELGELGAQDPRVLPILFRPPAVAARSPAGVAPPGAPTILFVGRLSPHKRQDRVLRAFALYRRHRAPDARLVLVGTPVSAAFGARLRELAEQLVPGAVSFESGLSAEQLWERYRSAHAFVCLSEHEGFCIPLLEAFHFGVPVIARPAGGVPEVADDAALLTDTEDPAVVAELLDLAVRDGELRAELARRAASRLEAYTYAHTAERIRAAVLQAAA